MGTAGNWAGTFIPTQNVETTTGSSFGAGNFVRMDFYAENGNATSGTSTYEGYFQLNGDGSAFFDPVGLVAVPEPATYGLLAGLGLLVLALRKQLTVQA